MCQKMKKPVKVDANGRDSGRKAQMSPEERMAEAEKRLSAIWKEKGLIETSSKYGNAAPQKSLPSGIDEIMLIERKVRYEGVQKGIDEKPVLLLFTVLDAEKKSLGSTIAIDADETNLISALDIKLKTVA